MDQKLSRKEKVYQVVRDLTRKAIAAKNYTEVGMDAYVISIILKIERSNASKELNDLWREGKLIKIQGRPILYLSLEDFLYAYPIKYIPTFIPKGKRLTDYLEAGDCVETDEEATLISPLDNQVGAHGSLVEQIASAKAAISYPPYGLPTLLCGNLGIGKMQFAHDMYEYALQTKIFNKQANFVIINCMDYANDPERLRIQLCGSGEKRTKNLIEQANGGVLFFDEIQKLDSKGKELLSDLIYKGSYTKGNESHPRLLNAMIIASTTEDLQSPAMITIAKYFSVILHLPDIDQRELKEKIELILTYFSKEAQRIKMPIRLSKDVLFCFVQAKYRTNNTQMKSEIRLACSKAYLDILTSHSRVLNISLGHLSNELLSRSYEGDSKKQIFTLLEQFPNDTLFFDEDGSCSDLASLYQPENEETILLEDGDIQMQLFDYTTQRLALLKTLQKHQLMAIKAMLPPNATDTVYELMERSGEFVGLTYDSNLFIGLILQLANAVKRSKNNIPAPFTINEQAHPDPTFIPLSKDIAYSVQSITNVIFSDLEIEGIANFLSAIHTLLTRKPIGVLVISHGSGIAREMVHFINPTEKDKFKIKALDYGYEMSLKEFMKSIYEEVIALNQGSGVLVISDMMPFSNLETEIYEACGIRSEVIMPLNLPLLVRIITELRTNSSDYCLSLEDFKEHKTQETETDIDSFLQRLTNDFLDEVLTFINPKKAVSTLRIALEGILDELSIPNDEAILVKFITHTTCMLERVIRKEPLAYQQLKSFMKQHSQLIQRIEDHLRYVNETFGIQIPPSELAYIAEIFLPYIKDIQ